MKSSGEDRLTQETGDRISRDRIVSLTDAVLAIVMTLLVLEIVVPEYLIQKLQLNFQSDHLRCYQLLGVTQQVS